PFPEPPRAPDPLVWWSTCRGIGARAARGPTGSRGCSPWVQGDYPPLRQRDTRAVTRRGDVEGTRRTVGRVLVRLPTRRRVRNRGHERTGRLVLTVGRDHREGGETRGHVTHVSAVDRDGRREGPGVGLGLGNPRARLHVGVERDGDGRQDADDRDDDHQLDERETALVATVQTTLVPKSEHTFLHEF